MALNVGQLQATLSIDTSGFTKGIEKAKSQLNSMGTTVKTNVSKTMDKAEESTDSFADSLKNTGKQAKNMASQVNTGTTAVKNQAKQTDAAKKKNAEWKNSIGDVKTAWTALKGVLGAIGITASVSAVVAKLKEFVEECNEAAKAYNDFVQGTQSATASATVSAQIQDMAVNAAASQELGNKKFSYEEYADAMVVLAQKYPDLLENEEKMAEMADTYLRFAEIAGSDVTSAIKDADAVMKAYSIDLEDQEDLLNKFYQISAKTGTPLSEMVSLLEDGEDAFTLLGYSAEEAAGYIAAVYQKTGSLENLSTLFSSVEKVSGSISGTEYEKSAFIQRVLEGTAGMSDSSEILSTITGIYEDMFPGLDSSGIQSSISDMASNLSEFTRASVTSGDISSILESTKDLDSLSDIAATSEQQTAYLESINGLLEKEYATVDQNLETALADIRYEASSNGENIVGYMNNTANESVDYFWRQRAAKYATYADYVMENARSSHRLFNTEEEWQANKNVVLNITDSTKDGIQIQAENNKTNIRSTNMPTYK